MLNKFKSIFSPKKTKKQNLKYSPYERKSPRINNREKVTENLDATNEHENKTIEIGKPTSNTKVLIIEESNKKEEIKEIIPKKSPKKIVENVQILNSEDESETTIKENDVEEIKREEKKKTNVIDEENNKSKRIKLSTFHYYGTGYSRNSNPYLPARKLQTKKSSVLYYKKKLINIPKEKPKNETKTTVPEISHTAKLILDVVEKEEKKYKKPMKMKKLEKKSSSIMSVDKKLDNKDRDIKSKSQDNKKTETVQKKRITPINILGPDSSDLEFNFVRKSSSYASHPDIIELTKTLSSESSKLPIFTFERKSSSYSFDGSSSEDDKKQKNINDKTKKDSPISKPVTTGFNWAAAGMAKPTLGADEWKCSVCDVKNKNSDDKCVCCEEPNPNKKTSINSKEAPKFTLGGSSTTSAISFGKPAQSNDTKPASTGFNWAAAGMKKPTLADDEWKCSVCDAKNKNTDDKCVCCEEPNPNKKASDKSKDASKFTFGGASTASTITFGKPPASTETKTAITFGKPAETTKTDNKPAASGFDWAAAGMKKPTLAADEWKCSVCDVKNKSTDDKCVCCEEPNPNKKSEKSKDTPKFTFGGSSGISFGKPPSSTETKTTITFGKPTTSNEAKTTLTFGKPAETTKTDNKTASGGFDWAAAGMKKPTLAADEWKCSVCDAKNKNTDAKCICCEEPNPNKTASDKPKDAPKFTFGGASAASTITFGKPAASSETKSTTTSESKDAKPAATGFDWAAAGMKKPTLTADEWKCNVCDAKNKNTDAKCVCCEEPNPNKTASDKPKDTSKFTFGGSSAASTITFGKPIASSETKTTTITFGKPAASAETKTTTTTESKDTKPAATGFDWAAAGMKKPTLAADEWKCSVCDAKNKSTDDKCVCCEEPNPNKKSTDKTKEASKFTFGSNTNKSTITFGNNTNTVTFGQNSNSSAPTFGFGKPFGSNASSNTITFGNTNTTSSSSKPVGFSFNTSTTNDNTKTTTTFSFGTSNTTATSNTFGSSTTTTTTTNKPFNTFSFGKPNNNTNGNNN